MFKKEEKDVLVELIDKEIDRINREFKTMDSIGDSFISTKVSSLRTCTLEKNCRHGLKPLKVQKSKFWMKRSPQISKS